MIVTPLAGLVLGRVGARVLIASGQFFLAGGLAWLALVATVDVTYADLVAPFVLAGVGMGLTFAPMSSLALSSVPEDAHGVASGTINTIRELGVALGVAVLASVFVISGSYDGPASFVAGNQPAVLVGAAIVAAGGVLALFLPRRT